MRVVLISTQDTNIGDDLIRTGIESALHDAVRTGFSSKVVNKHRPLELYRSKRAAAIISGLPRGQHLAADAVSRVLRGFARTEIDDADLVVYAGTPLFWPGFHTSEWSGPLWRDAIPRKPSSTKLLCLAIGSAYPWLDMPDAIDKEPEEALVHRILGSSSLTTVRDKLAQKLLRQSGYEVPVLPCTAFLSGQIDPAQKPGNEILLNYMRGGGHFSWGQDIDDHVWRRKFQRVVKELASIGPTRFICHSTSEYQECRTHFPDVPASLPRSPAEYLATVGSGAVGFVNRMHAAVGMASVGVPSIAVGTDSRLLMLDELGLGHIFVSRANVEDLVARVSSLLSNLEAERRRLAALQRGTRDSYKRLIAGALGADPIAESD